MGRAVSLSATMASGQNEILSKAEDIADKVTRSSKHVLPHLARFCLVSTFFEDGIRMWVQWSEQREYMDISWGCGWFLATLFVVTNLIGQLGAVAMVLTRCSFFSHSFQLNWSYQVQSGYRLWHSFLHCHPSGWALYELDMFG